MKRSHRCRWIAVAVTLTILAAPTMGSAQDETFARQDASSVRQPVAEGSTQYAVEKAPIVPGYIHVKFTPAAMPRLDIRMAKTGAMETGLASVDALNREARVRTIEQSFPNLANRELSDQIGMPRWHLMTVPEDVDTQAMAARYAGDPNVEAATAVIREINDVVPNDPMYLSNWGHNNTGQLLDYCWPYCAGCPDPTLGCHEMGSPVGTPGFDADAEAAWGGGYGSSSVVIAVIDGDGFDTSHPDINYVAGYDFVGGDPDPSPVGDDAHGTACAGVAAATANNALGVVGIAGGCRIMPLKSSGSVSHASAITYAADNGAEIASMSWTFYGYTSIPDVDNALTYAFGQGVVLLSSSGNRNESTLWVPQNHANVIAVGSASPCGDRKRSSSSSSEVNPGVLTDPNGYTCEGERWWGSSYGNTTQGSGGAVDCIAPTILPTTDITGANGYSTTDYTMWFNGTSCSTPYAAGVCALILTHNPAWTPTQVRTQLRNSCTDIVNVESGAGWDRFSGYGMVNAGLAVGQPDLTWTLEPGWFDEIVAREDNTATISSVLPPVTLPGDLVSGSFSNGFLRNLGATSTGTGWTIPVRLDGATLITFSGPDLVPSQGAFWTNSPFTARGGRHTLEGLLDPGDVVQESDESNNDYAQQYVWTPVTLGHETYSERAGLPDALGGHASIPVGDPSYVNTDGQRIAPDYGVGFWNAVAVHSLNDAEDVDMAFFDPSTGPFNGFDTVVSTSYRGAGFTEGLIVNRNFLNNTYDVGTAAFSAPSNYITEHRASIFPVFNLGTVQTSSFDTHQMVALRELWVGNSQGGPVTVELMVHDAVQPMILGLCNYDWQLGGIGNATWQMPTDAEGRALLTQNLMGGQYYGIVVYRNPIDGVDPLDITLRVTGPPVATVSKSAAGRISLYNVPDATGLGFDEAWQWNGVPGSTPLPVDGTVRVHLADAFGNVIAGLSAQSIQMTTSYGGLQGCPLDTHADGDTDAAGDAYFVAPLEAGGHTNPGVPGVLIDCNQGQSGGDFISRGFYIANYPGTTLDQVDLWLASFTAGSYTYQLTARLNAYDGPILGTAQATVTLSSDVNDNRMTAFEFPSIPVPPGQTVAFINNQIAGPGTSYYGVGAPAGCPDVFETFGTTPPLDSIKNDGVRIKLHATPVMPEVTQIEVAGFPVAQTVYGSGTLLGCDNSGNLFKINLATGAGTLICTLQNGSTEIEYDETSGRAFSQLPDGSYQIQEFDVADCTSGFPPVPTVDASTGGSLVFMALEFVNGVLYGAGVSNPCTDPIFYEVNPSTGAATQIGGMGLARNLSGMAYDPLGNVLYGIEGCQTAGTSNLVTIDMTTGLATLIGDTQIPAGSLAIGPDGELYAGTSSTDGGNLWRLDRTTAAATLVGPTGFLPVSGLTLLHPHGLDIQHNSADIDGSLRVDLVDVSRFSIDLNQGYEYRSDFYWDGDIDLRDVSRMSQAVGAQCVAPKAPNLAKTSPENTIGVYFDLAGSRRSVVAEPGETIEAYVLLEGPLAEAGILAWEARIESSENVVIRDVRLGDGHLDVGQAPDLIVGLGRELSAEGKPLHLATLQLSVSDTQPGHLYVRPASLETAGRAPVAVSAREDLVPLGIAADGDDAPAAFLNDETMSGGESRFVFAGVHLRNVPNPFNPQTEIRFDLPRRGRAEVRIYNVAGRLVRTLDGGVLAAGPHALRWSGTDDRNAQVVSGMYFYRLFLDHESLGDPQKMILLK